jgi:hypothetical protein
MIDLCTGSTANSTPAGFVLSTVAATMAALAMLAKAGWHLLAAIRPRFGGGFGSPAAGSARGPGTEQWEDARELAATLRAIAVAKHRQVARSIPWLIAAGVASAIAAAVAIAGGVCLWFPTVAS